MYLEKCKKSEFRTVIKHLYLKGLTPKEIKSELDEVHGTSAPVFATVYNGVNEFKCGHTSTKDQSIKVREIVEATGISQGTVFSILHEEFGVKKISARRVPRLLSEENKRNYVINFEVILAFFRRNSDEFLH